MKPVMIAGRPIGPGWPVFIVAETGTTCNGSLATALAMVDAAAAAGVDAVKFQIIGADTTVSMASEASELELNMAEPIIAFNLLFGLTLLRNAAIVLNTRCIAGIEANRERCLQYVQNSIGLVTALNPVLGYEKSVAIAKEALASGRSVYDLALEKGWLTRAQLDDILSPEKMTHPRKLR